MSQIKLQVLKQGLQYNNVISVSFFTMPGAYRNVEVYQKNLKSFLSKTKSLKEFEVRIYTDDTGRDFVLEVSRDKPEVTVIRYDCTFFHEEKGHTGTFGTIVRFLPLFEKDLDFVWISDIDIHPSFLDMNIIARMKETNANIFIDSALCYDRKPWTNVKYPIIAHRFISRVKFSRQMLTHFLTKLMDGKFEELIEDINAYNTRKTPNVKFPYGMDEAFLNGPIYSHIKKDNLKVIVRKDFFTQSFLSYNIEDFPEKDTEILSKYYKNPTPELFKKCKEIYKKYVPLVTDKYQCMQELLDNMPNFKKSFLVVKLLKSNEL